MTIRQMFKDILDCNSGATAVEYGLIVSLLVVALIGAFNAFADGTIGMWDRVETSISEAGQ